MTGNAAAARHLTGFPGFSPRIIGAAHTVGMPKGTVPLFALEGYQPIPTGLADAARETVDALQALGALEPQHALDAMIVLKLAEAVEESRGVAKSQMFGALLAARARLPVPVLTVEPEALDYEGRRAIEYFRAHSSELANEEDAEEVD